MMYKYYDIDVLEKISYIEFHDNKRSGIVVINGITETINKNEYSELLRELQKQKLSRYFKSTLTVDKSVWEKG